MVANASGVMATAAESVPRASEQHSTSQAPLLLGIKLGSHHRKHFLRSPHAIFTRGHKGMGGKPKMVSKT